MLLCVCMHGRQHFTLVHTYYECNVFLCVCMHGKTIVVRTMHMSAMCCYAVCMHDKTTLVRTYYELNVLLCLSKTTMVCTYYI